MSMISEQIKRLRKTAESLKKSGLAADGIALKFEQAAKTIEELSEKLHNLQMERSSQYYNGGWTPTTERLPENSGIYIVTREFNDGVESADLTDACYFDGTCTWHNDNRVNHGRGYVSKKIKAWMPLPEPYKT